MKKILLSLFLMLIVVCLVHTQSCKEKCKGKPNPRECRERCRGNGTTSDNQESCKKQCKRKRNPKVCVRKCQCKKQCEGKPDDCLQKCPKGKKYSANNLFFSRMN